MKRVEITVGQGFDKHNKPLTGCEYKRKAAFKVAAELFGGYSVSFVSGGWVNGKGELIEEPSMVIVIYTDQAPIKVMEFAELVKDLFSQTSVVVATVDASVVFVV